VGALVGTLLTLAALVMRPVEAVPWNAVGFAVCDKLIGIVVTYTDGSTVAIAPLEASQDEADKVMALVKSLPPERKGVIQLAVGCQIPGRT
jgi:hypothetical protein